MSTRTDTILPTDRVSEFPRKRHLCDLTTVAASETYDATAEDHLIVCTGACTVRLPHADLAVGASIIVVAKSVSGGNVTVSVQDAHDPIDGTTSVTLSSANLVKRVVSDGAAWYVS